MVHDGRMDKSDGAAAPEERQTSDQVTETAPGRGRHQSLIYEYWKLGCYKSFVLRSQMSLQTQFLIASGSRCVTINICPSFSGLRLKTTNVLLLLYTFSCYVFNLLFV